MALSIPPRFAAMPIRPLLAAMACFSFLFLAGCLAVDPVGSLLWVNLGIRQMWLLLLGFAFGWLIPGCRFSSPASLARVIAKAAVLVVAAIMIRHTSAPFLYLTIYDDAHRITSWLSFVAGASVGLAVSLARTRHLFSSAFERVFRFHLPLPVLLLGASLLFLPEVWAYIADNWNTSGFMDSQMYDQFSHEIALGLRPLGSSYYMPLYQFGLAAIYYAFGHFFWLQQVVNGLAASATLFCIGLTAWNIFKDKRAVLLALILAAATPTLHHNPIQTQIENWYIPLFALTVLLFTVYWSRPTIGNGIVYALALGLLLNTRSQGAFYVMISSLMPLLALPKSGIKKAAAHVMLIWLIVGATLLPWSVRNSVEEGRFSPGTEQGPLQMAIMNDKRIGFYGLRFDINYFEILSEYRSLYPDAAQRVRECSRIAREKLTEDPLWTLRAIFWRSLAFYGLVPASVWSWSPADTPEPVIDWAEALKTGFSLRTPQYIALFYLIGSLAGLALRPRRFNLALALLILGNFLVVLFVGFNEDRIHYPSLLLHLPLILSIFWSPRLRDDAYPVYPVATKRFALAVPAILLLGLVFLAVSHQVIGRHHQHAAIPEPISIDPAARPDAALPLFSDILAPLPPLSTPPVAPGQRVLLTLRLSNYAYPPAFAAFPGSPLKFIPPFANDPRKERFYYASLIPSSAYYPQVAEYYYGQAVSSAGVSFYGARCDAPLREGDLVLAEAEALIVPPLAAGPPDESKIINPWFRIMAMKRLGPGEAPGRRATH